MQTNKISHNRKMIGVAVSLTVIFLCILIYYMVVFLIPYKNQKLQNLVDMYLSVHKADEYISTAAMTVQCKDKNGKTLVNTVYTGTLGHGDNPIEKRKTDKNDLFQIGSITKSFISVVLLQLQDETKNTPKSFSIDDHVGKWFPEEKYKNWHNVTIRQLLNMTSGIPNITFNIQFNNFYMQNPYHYFSLEEILDYESDKPLNFMPGTKYEYSNTNYTLAGLLIERLTGNSFEEEVKKRVIEKLKLQHTVFPRNFAKDVYPYQKLVHGYTFIGEKRSILESMVPKDFALFPDKTDTTNFTLSDTNAAGAILSTTQDVNTYIQALFSEGQLLSASQIEDLKKNEFGILAGDDAKITATFGLGVEKIHNKESNEIFYTYTGSMYGFRFAYFYYPDRNLNIVLATNSGPLLKEETFVPEKVIPEIWQKICY